MGKSLSFMWIDSGDARMKKLKSKCCDRLVRTEVWVSKERRRIHYCLECGQPCEVKKARRGKDE